MPTRITESIETRVTEIDEIAEIVIIVNDEVIETVEGETILVVRIQNLEIQTGTKTIIIDGSHVAKARLDDLVRTNTVPPPTSKRLNPLTRPDDRSTKVDP